MEDRESYVASHLERFRPVLLTLAEALISPSFRGDLEASDLVQETLLEAHCNREKLANADEGQFFSWLRQALRHNLLDAVRHLKTQKNDIRRRFRASELEDSAMRLERVLVADDTSPSQVVERTEKISIMLAALQDLPKNQRMALIMKHLRGHTLREIAQELQISESASAGLLHRGRITLVRLLEEGAGV